MREWPEHFLSPFFSRELSLWEGKSHKAGQ